MVHLPVLLQEVIDGLQANKGDVILDATVGGGGHSEAICAALGGEARFVCLDADEEAILRSRTRLEKCGCEFLFYRTNFRHLDEALAFLGIQTINRALFDLGLSGDQLEESGRGFSFRGSEPLIMTFAKNPEEGTLTAEKIVNEWEEETIATILKSYGEERQARRIAEAIAEARTRESITTSERLARIISEAVPRRGRRHPATKTFQALRMAANDELGALQEGLRIAWEALAQRGRIAVISFHSLEDRLVKRFFRERGEQGAGRVITKKPITPARQELLRNPRSRSAKLRIIEKLK